MSNISIKTARSGDQIPAWDGLNLHSAYDPVKEGNDTAQKFISTISPESIQQISQGVSIEKPLVILGLGFGYHILPLLDKFKKIFVAESNHELISHAKNVQKIAEIFQKCEIISDIASTPYLPDFYFFMLKSEKQYQEKFFDDVIESCKLSDKQTPPQLNQIRAIINSPVYGGSYTTAKYMESALSHLGVCVEFTDHGDADPLLKKYLLNQKANAPLIDQLTSLLSETLWHDIIAYKPHIVFFTAQSPFTDSLLQAIKKAGIITVYWFVEDFRRMTYWSRIINRFDYFFMIQRGEFDDILSRTSRNIWGWFPMAADPRHHKPVSMSESEKAMYGSDISFMGAAYPNRVRFFSRFRKDNLKLWGTGWSDSLPDYQIPLSEHRISTQQSNIIYQATKVNINIHSSNDGYQDTRLIDEIGDFVNPRTFEIAACGGFQLVDDRVAVRELFDADTEMVFFTSVDEALDKADFFIKNESLRKKIALAAQQKVLSHHTYDIRLQKMLDIILHHSPTLKVKISEELSKLDTILDMIQDDDFTAFIDSFEPGVRSSYEKVLSQIRTATGSLKNYEAFLLLLDTFYIGE
jgi:spore maturation protein CgeB